VGKRAIVTGGGGFIGAYLVQKLLEQEYSVGVVESFERGLASRLSPMINDIDLFECDVRDEDSLYHAFQNADVVFHLAAVNGTENFYKHPELVLDVGIRGAISVMNAARKSGVPDVVVASSAEVYQTPSVIPTDETIPLMLPDSLNPRYSYGGSKIASEIIAFNYGIDFFNKVQVFRPHNIYGPNMGYKHVVPQFIKKAIDVKTGVRSEFVIQGDGSETRAFCYVDDVVDGILLMYEKGSNREVYHIGNDDEVAIRTVASRILDYLDVSTNIINSDPAEGGTARRCPSIEKMKVIGYDPKINLDSGLEKTIEWYASNLKDIDPNSLL